MATCPDCESIIMEGDPYCSHCGAHLSWSSEDSYNHEADLFEGNDYSFQSDSKIPAPLRDFYASLEDEEAKQRVHQKLLKKISEKYKVELEEKDIKDGYTEYIFLRKTPYYTLRMVATDQYGMTIGIKPDSLEFDYTKLKENKDFKEMTKDLDIKKISVNVYRDEIHIFTDDKRYRADMENRKLIEEELPIKQK